MAQARLVSLTIDVAPPENLAGIPLSTTDAPVYTIVCKVNTIAKAPRAAGRAVTQPIVRYSTLQPTNVRYGAHPMSIAMILYSAAMTLVRALCAATFNRMTIALFPGKIAVPMPVHPLRDVLTMFARDALHPAQTHWFVLTVTASTNKSYV